MKKVVFPVACAVGLFLAACLTAPDEPAAVVSGLLSCEPGKLAFNGACRSTCTTSAQCASPNTCMTVSAGAALCLDYAACAYLGSDTECSRVSYGGYGSYHAYGHSSSSASYPTATGYGSNEPLGCGGNATWQVASPSAVNDPKCGEPHRVVRCQNVGNQCGLVSGTTIDIADR